ncbi:hypothetical protein [Hyalangium versicolor]|nr:hypothetical protein [Hyalangium versicolor]
MVRIICSARPDALQEKDAVLIFPWDVPEIISRDARLVAQISGD